MNWLAIIVSVSIIILFGIVFFGAPFVPTKKTQIGVALDLLNLKRGQILLDLGAGDGRVALAAAKRGLRVRCYELNGLLALIAIIRTWPYRDQVSVRLKNYWYADLSEADGIFIFSAERFMKRLDKKIVASGRKLKLASFAFIIPDRPITVGLAGVYLYEYDGKPKSKLRKKHR